jgi:VWFA-related protein
MARERPIRPFLPAAAALLLLAALPALAQESPLPDLFSDTIDVRVVNVEVVVTDRKGNRIQGLEPGDFELWVDGERVPIDYFTEIDDGTVRGITEQRIDEEAMPAVPSLEPDEPVRTNYLVFIDEYFAVRKQRDRVLKRLERDLAELGPHDHVALVAFDGRNVAQLTEWTASRDELRNAFREARRREALGMMRRTDTDPAATSTSNPDRAAQALDAAVEGLGARSGARQAASALNLSKRERDIQRSVLAAVATVRSFADPPGRKAMLVLTDGWGVPSWDNPDPLGPMAPSSIESIYGPLVHAANLVGYTLYPVDLAGLNPRFATSPFGIADVSVGYNAGAGTSSSSVQPSPFAAPQGLNLEWSQDAAFGYLAHETGGLPMVNAFRDIALAEAVADTRHYYWLGFEPARKQDDELHAIEVRLAGRPDLRLRSRQSYLDLSKSAELTMMVEGSVLFGGAPGKETLEVRFGPPGRARGRKILLPMEVAIPLDDVELLPMGGRFTNELEFRATVINEAGERSETPLEKIRISGSAEPPPGAVFVYETTLLIRSLEHRYVVSIYDPLTGAVLSAKGTIGPR